MKSGVLDSLGVAVEVRQLLPVSRYEPRVPQQRLELPPHIRRGPATGRENKTRNKTETETKINQTLTASNNQNNRTERIEMGGGKLQQEQLISCVTVHFVCVVPRILWRKSVNNDKTSVGLNSARL